MDEINNAYGFICECFIQLSARDFYIIAREYALNEDWQQEKLKEILANDGWEFNEDGSMYK